MLTQPVSPHLSPNVTPHDLGFVIGALLTPFRWFSFFSRSSITELEHAFQSRFGASYVKSFDSGRSALTAILDSLDMNDGDLVITQAFTCVVVPNSIIASGARPLYVDVDDSYNLDPIQLELALEAEPRVRAVIVQHTFGTPADLEKIVALCTQYNVILVEDCAHALGARYQGKEVGSFGDAALFSFGRDKVLSTVSGGVAIATHPFIGQGLQRIHTAIQYPSVFWLVQRLMHPLLFSVAKKLYYVGSVGKMIIAGARYVHLIPLVLTAAEKNGRAERIMRMPPLIAQWALLQLEQLPEFHTHRKQLATLYATELHDLPLLFQAEHQDSESSFLRFSFTSSRQTDLFSALRKSHVLLGDWYTTPIGPADCSLESVGYTNGSCPKAEQFSRSVVNLPTNYSTSVQDAHVVSQAIRNELL